MPSADCDLQSVETLFTCQSYLKVYCYADVQVEKYYSISVGTRTTASSAGHGNDLLWIYNVLPARNFRSRNQGNL